VGHGAFQARPARRSWRGCRLDGGCTSTLAEAAQGFGEAGLIGFDELVPGGVGFFIDLLASRVGIEPGDGSPNPFRERDFGAEAGNKALDLGVVENNARCFISREAAYVFRIAGAQKIGGDVHELRLDDVGLDAGGLRRDPIELVPGHDFVAGNVEGMANGLLMTDESDQALGEVAVVGDDPKRGAITRHDDLFAAAHAIDGREGLLPAIDRQHDLRVAVGERGANDGDGKALFAVGAHEAVFTGDLVARVLPVGIGQRCGFGNEVVTDRPLIGAGGADKDELAGTVAKQANVAFHVGWGEGDPVDNGIEGLVGEHIGNRGFIGDIGRDGADVLRKIGCVLAAPQQGQVNATLGGQPGGSCADDAGAADECLCTKMFVRRLIVSPLSKARSDES